MPFNGFNKKEIQEQFNKVIKYSQNLDEVNSDDLFDRWFEAKRDFIESFGGNLIVELPKKVTFDLTEKEKRKRIEDFLTMVDYNYGNGELAQFIDIQKEGFYQNEVISEFYTGDTKIPKGMKLLKAFKFFVNDEKTLEEIQNAASMIIQEDKVSGYLCLSVHPLDFISASENCHKWHSCHALDGEYRAGNLSYMVDKNTIMCYLRAEKPDYKLPNFPESVPWNSKKWRVWIYVSNDWDMLFAGRQYPFSSKAGLDFAKKEIIEPALKTFFTDFTNQYFSARVDFTRNGKELMDHESVKGKLMIVDGEMRKMNGDIVKNANGSLAFNDLLCSSTYVKPYYAYRVVEREHWLVGKRQWLGLKCTESDKFIIGGKVKCLCCGKNYLENNNSVICNDCWDKYNDNDDNDELYDLF